MPPVEHLKRALVARWQHETAGTAMDEAVAIVGGTSTDKVRRVATIAAKLCAKLCFFCGTAKPQPKGAVTGKAVAWDKFELCNCLAQYRQDRVFHRPAQTPGDLLEILQLVDSRQLRDSAEVYTTSCSGRIPEIDAKTGVRTVKPCDCRFTIRAGSLAHAVRGFLAHSAQQDARQGVNRAELERLALFRLPAKCRACRDRTRAALEKPAAAADVRSNAAPAGRRKKTSTGKQAGV